MKFLIAISFLATLFINCDAFLYKPSYNYNKNCINQVANCADTTPVCGRFGRSDLCKNFANVCALRYENCIGKSTYTVVDSTLCTGISLNRRTFCNGLGSAPISNGNYQVWKPIYAGCIKGKNCGYIL